MLFGENTSQIMNVFDTFLLMDFHGRKCKNRGCDFSCWGFVSLTYWRCTQHPKGHRLLDQNLPSLWQRIRRRDKIPPSHVSGCGDVLGPSTTLRQRTVGGPPLSLHSSSTGASWRSVRRVEEFKHLRTCGGFKSIRKWTHQIHLCTCQWSLGVDSTGWCPSKPRKVIICFR